MNTKTLGAVFAISLVAAISSASPQFGINWYSSPDRFLHAVTVDERGVGFGYSDMIGDGASARATVYRAGKVEVLPKIVPGDTRDTALFESSSGLVYGQTVTPSGVRLWSYDPRTSQTSFINGFQMYQSPGGVIYGQTPEGRAGILRNGVWETLIQVPNVGSSWVTGVSNEGEIVGFSFSSPNSFSWRIKNGVYSEITQFRGVGRVTGITAGGLIFGEGASALTGFVNRPIVLLGDSLVAYPRTTPSGDMLWNNSRVTDAGFAAGTDRDGTPYIMTLSGEKRLVDSIGWKPGDWIPRDSAWASSNGHIIGDYVGQVYIATPVPEPSVMIAMGVGIAALARRRRPRRVIAQS